MSPKNAIKKINIQKSYLVHFGFVQSTLVLFGLVSPLDLILSTSVLFGPHWFYSVHFVHFGPLQSYSDHSVHYSHIRPVLYTLFLFGPLLSYSIHYVHFGPIWSSLVLFGPICSYSVHYIHFVPNLSIRLFGQLQSYSIPFVPIPSICVHFSSFLCTYLYGKYMLRSLSIDRWKKMSDIYIFFLRMYLDRCDTCF